MTNKETKKAITDFNNSIEVLQHIKRCIKGNKELIFLQNTKTGIYKNGVPFDDVETIENVTYRAIEIIKVINSVNGFIINCNVQKYDKDTKSFTGRYNINMMFSNNCVYKYKYPYNSANIENVSCSYMSNGYLPNLQDNGYLYFLTEIYVRDKTE